MRTRACEVPLVERRSPVDDSVTRTALLDAAAALMLEEGYAAVTTRRLAQRAGVNNGLVSYYFGTLDALFIELFRRGAERSLARLRQALQSRHRKIGRLLRGEIAWDRGQRARDRRDYGRRTRAHQLQDIRHARERDQRQRETHAGLLRLAERKH